MGGMAPRSGSALDPLGQGIDAQHQNRDPTPRTPKPAPSTVHAKLCWVALKRVTQPTIRTRLFRSRYSLLTTAYCLLPTAYCLLPQPPPTTQTHAWRATVDLRIT